MEIKSIRDVPEKEFFEGGSPTCVGCPLELGLKLALKALGKNTIIVNSSSCATLLCNYPYTPLKVPWIHNAIENAPATAIGINHALKRLGRKATVLCYIGDGACYSADTDILTEKGFKNIKNLKTEEKIWSANPKNNELELVEMEKLHKYNFKGKMIRVKSRYLDFLITKDHNFPIWRNNHWEFIRAEELKNRYKTRVLRHFEWKGKSIEKVKIKQIPVKTNQKVYYEFPVKEWLNFIGWYISKGSLYHSNSGYTITIYQSNKKNRKEILNIIKKLGLNPYECKRSVNFQSKQIYKTLEKECGRLPINRRIPDWILELDKKYLKCIFETLIKGNGYVSKCKNRTKKRTTFITKSKKLADTFVELVLKIGWNCTVSVDKRKIYRIGIDKEHLDHMIYSNRKDLNLIQVKEENYSGYVYCPQLPKNHTVIIKRNGRISLNGNSYDIGFQSLSFAATCNEPMVYVCYNNESYGNTGVQWATSTPFLASTKTTPAGSLIPRKNMVEIMAAHKIYSASASLAFPFDYMNKLRKAKAKKGFTYIELLAACPAGWGFDSSLTIKISRLAVETGIWPLYEVEDNKLKMSYMPAKLKPVEEFLKLQERYRHLTKKQIKLIQAWVDKEWKSLTGGEYWGVLEY